MKRTLSLLALFAAFGSLAAPAMAATAHWRLTIICRNADCTRYSKVYTRVSDLRAQPGVISVEQPLSEIHVVQAGTPAARLAEEQAQKK